ncbi:tetratricopeptide repeat protein [Caballeronia insecticola]|uniref:TPR repeat-containing protein n=1 Tax=Caballeronia insecticola TaxID=758793 RepID=R4WXC0_9BURK|nr:tetratricopeptide repeat protein [Caballeronia insecticola]BAN22637.1 TPR repeat-containing protein [Caballeronia insecticola]
MTAEILSTHPAAAEPAPRSHQEFDEAELAHLAEQAPLSGDADRLCALGRLHLRQHNPTRAIERLDAALALAPDNADLLNDRAIAALMLADYDGAIDRFRHAIRCTPDNARLHCNLGNAMRDAGRREDALPHFARALELDPRMLDAVLANAELLEQLGRPHDALVAYRDARNIAPDDMRGLLGEGYALNAMKRHVDAEAMFRQAAQREPDNIHAVFGLALTLGSQLRFEDALEVYGRALALVPDNASVHNNVGFMLTCLARYDEADEHLRRTIQLKPDMPDANKVLGMSELRRGHYRAGWAMYEFRKAGGEAGGYPALDIPEWQGEPLAGKRIVLNREQGAGDQFQFIRYAGVLRAMGATVDVWATEALAPLLARADGIDRAITEMPRDGYDYYCPVMSVPHRLADEAIPARVPYLSADAALAAIWRERFDRAAGQRRKVGIVWAGNPGHHLDRFRSIPLDRLLPLAELPGLAWFALQKGVATRQLAECADRWPITPLDAQLDSFVATAAAIEALDLVVTVDTSVAHLAGALGKPVWIMLPAQADWRWMIGRVDNPWYPSARLFRQHTLGDWSPVVDELRAALAALGAGDSVS